MDNHFPAINTQVSEGRVSLLGVAFDPLSVDALHRYIDHRIKAGQRSLILNVNVMALNLAYQLPWLRSYFNKAELVFVDGAGVVLAGKLLGYTIPRRITYADWMWELARFGEEQQFSFFFLGGKPGIAQKAAQRLMREYPNLRIVGARDGYFEKTHSGDENIAVIIEINKAQPDILIVGFGMPLQEKWLMENWADLNAGVALTGGAVFDYISGDLRRAPRWMTDHGFEWLGRLIIEPQRLWKRYLIGNPVFFWRVLLQKFGLLKIE